MAILYHFHISIVVGGPWRVVIQSMLLWCIHPDVPTQILTCQRHGNAGPAVGAWSLAPSRSGESDTHELPTSLGWEKVPIRGPDMRLRGRTRSAAQHKLVGHKFAVILPERARRCGVPRIGGIVTLRPFPDVPKHLGQRDSAIALTHGNGMEGSLLHKITPDRQRHRRDFPFDLGGQ